MILLQSDLFTTGIVCVCVYIYIYIYIYIYTVCPFYFYNENDEQLLMNVMNREQTIYMKRRTITSITSVLVLQCFIEVIVYHFIKMTCS